jgi:hypothetical protein
LTKLKLCSIKITEDGWLINGLYLLSSMVYLHVISGAKQLQTIFSYLY